MKRFVLCLLLAVSLIAHADLPSSGYDLATVTNPSATLTNFTLLIDLSTMSASWWSAAEDTAATRGRAAKDSGPTELAVDWIDYNHGAQTGWARVLWSSNLTTGDTQKVRIYPPLSTNSSYSASDTYGSDNAYDSSWYIYWTMDESPDGSPAAVDRTANGLDGTNAGGMNSGDAIAGKIANAVDFDGSTNDWIWINTIASGNPSDFPMTFMAWMRPESLTNAECRISFGNSAETNELIGIRTSSSGTAELYNYTYSGGSDGNANYNGLLGTTSLDLVNWWHVAGVFETRTNRRVYTNGSDEQSDTDDDAFPSAMDRFGVGAFVDSTPSSEPGQLDEVQVHLAARSAAWIAEEYAQSNNQGTFWSTWTWQAGGESPASVVPQLMHYYRQQQ